MNKRGFLRIVEAVISIVLVMSVLFIYYNRQAPQVTDNYTERAAEILEEISKTASLREEVVMCNAICDPIPTDIENFVANRIPEDFLDYEIRICDSTSACGITQVVEEEVFSAERTISSTIETYSPRKVRLFIWRKP